MNALRDIFDYAAIHREVCPPIDSLTQGQRAHRKYPLAGDMYAFLSLLHSIEFHDNKSATTPVCPAYFAALNNALIGSPEKRWADGSPYVTHRLTAKGRAYLCWLKVVTHQHSTTEQRDEYNAEWLDALAQLEITHG